MSNELEYTGPENRGVCGFCGGEEGGYAKKDDNGKFRPACWPCVRPATAGLTQPKRNTVGSTVEQEPAKAKPEPVHTRADAIVRTPDAPMRNRRASGRIDTAKAVELYQGGMRIAEIAVQFGYTPGQGQNATREVLKAAGAYKAKV